MNIAIIGSRSICNEEAYRMLKNEIAVLNPTTIISGGSKGVGEMAETIANRNGYDLETILPEWEKYGKQAAVIRNQAIIKKADYVLAVWDGKSKGTMNEITLAKRLKKPLKVIAWQGQRKSEEQLSLL